jgi:hypothetical protein
MMKTQFLILSLLATLLTTQSSFGQVAPAPATIPGYTEGPISNVVLQPDGSVIMTVIGVSVKVPIGTPVHSPTRALTLRQLSLRTKLPGRLEAGFLGGTALVNGVVDVATGSFTATDMHVEPAENVLIGVVTQSSPLRILNSEVVPISDARIPFSITNQFGFDVKPTSIPVGSAAAAAGYYADNKFQTFSLELAGDFPLVNPNSQINIMRAQTRERGPNATRGDDVDMRGFYHFLGGVLPTIRIYRVDNNVRTLLGTAIAIPDGVQPRFGVWNFKISTPPTTHPVLGTLPVHLQAVMVTFNGTSEVESAIASADPDQIP